MKKTESAPASRRPLSLAVRLFLAFMVALCGFVAVSIYGIVSTSALADRLGNSSTVYLGLSGTLAHLEFSLRRQEDDVKRALEAADGRVRGFLVRQARQYAEENSAARQDLDKALAQAGKVDRDALAAEDRKALTAFDGRLRELKRLLLEYQSSLALTLTLYDQAEEAPPDPAEIQRRQAELVRDQRRLERQLRDTQRLLKRQISSGLAAARSASTRIGWGMIVLTAFATLLALSMTIYAEGLLRPVNTLIDVVRRWTRGEYEVRLSPRLSGSAAELSTLATELDALAAALRSREDDLAAAGATLEQAHQEVRRTNLNLLTLKRHNENIVRSIRLGVVVTDAELHVTSLNPAAAGIWRKKEAELLQAPVLALFGAHPLLASRQNLLRVMAQGEVLTLEGVAIGEAASALLLDLAVVPLRTAEGEADGIIIIADEVTEKQALRQRLLHMERLAAVGRLTAQIAHEIRNPLNSIGLNAELLAEDVAAIAEDRRDAATHLLASIQREVERLTEVTEEYLRFARLPAPQLADTPINELIANLMSFLGAEIKAAKVETVLRLEPAMPVVAADPNQLRQALLNILRNALEAMPGGGALTVATSLSGGEAEITVADTGQGIGAADLQRVFDPFFSRKAGGTGLGLTLTQQIIREHGGEIVCESTVGAGTIFRIALPAKR